MSVRATIVDKLTRALEPAELEVIDESHLHAGHAGARKEGESHFRVRIVSPIFVGLGRVARQRLVYRALAEDMASDIHALAIDARAPDETR